MKIAALLTFVSFGYSIIQDAHLPSLHDALMLRITSQLDLANAANFSRAFKNNITNHYLESARNISLVCGSSTSNLLFRNISYVYSTQATSTRLVWSRECVNALDSFLSPMRDSQTNYVFPEIDVVLNFESVPNANEMDVALSQMKRIQSHPALAKINTVVYSYGNFSQTRYFLKKAEFIGLSISKFVDDSAKNLAFIQASKRIESYYTRDIITSSTDTILFSPSMKLINCKEFEQIAFKLEKFPEIVSIVYSSKLNDFKPIAEKFNGIHLKLKLDDDLLYFPQLRSTPWAIKLLSKVITMEINHLSTNNLRVKYALTFY